jgi:hypothetical protein
MKLKSNKNLEIIAIIKRKDIIITPNKEKEESKI